MAEITAAMVKELREKSGAGMMDCKKALNETGGDIEAAIDWLRKNGLAAAAKKSGRAATEGLVGVALADGKGAMVEVNAETDFVARNEQFQSFVQSVAEIALKTGDDLDALKAADFPGTGRTVEDELTQLIATIGENMSIRRGVSISGNTVVSYIHNQSTPGLGKIGVLVALDDGGNGEIGKQVAMHIAATNPQSLSVDDLDPAAVERERSVLIEQAKASGKTEEIAQKMVEGRLRKYYEEVVLLEQTFVIDGESRVKKAVEEAGAKVASYERFGLGEGLEKKEDDFAAEVAKMAG